MKYIIVIETAAEGMEAHTFSSYDDVKKYVETFLSDCNDIVKEFDEDGDIDQVHGMHEIYGWFYLYLLKVERLCNHEYNR